MANFLARQFFPCNYAGQNQVKYRTPCIHHTTGQAHNGNFLITFCHIAKQEHCPRQGRRPIGDNLRTGRPNSRRCPVIRVNAHAPGANDHIHAQLYQFLNMLLRVLYGIIGQAMLINDQAKGV